MAQDLPAIVNLQTNRDLLNPNFDGYKLSLEPVPVLKRSLASLPRRVFTNEDQYTFLHAKLFSLHSHLFRDPWLAYSSYFVDDEWTVQNIRYDNNAGQLDTVKSVLKISKPTTVQNPYNPSLCFVSEKYCVLSDGCGRLIIIDTGDRYRNEEWKSIFSATVFDDSAPFVIQDANLEVNSDLRSIHCILLSIQHQREAKKDDLRFEAVIDWISFAKDGNSNQWQRAHAKQLRGKSLPDYCALESQCKAILLSADKSFDFVADSEHPIEVSKAAESAQPENEPNAINFVWTQTNEDVSIYFNIPRDCSKSDIKIVCTATKIHVQHLADALLDAELYEKIDNDLTTWNLENEQLHVTLIKLSTDPWKSLLKDIEIHPIEHPKVESHNLPQPPKSTLRAEMEDCDFGDGDLENDYSFVRIDAVTHKTSHESSLGLNNHILFSLSLRAGHPPAFALRNDVDVCLWLPSSQIPLAANESSQVKLVISHEGTLDAFGYIQASKQQKKYLQCSPDMGYAVICEPHRHIFIYKSTYESASGLKNRNKSTQVSIGQQKLVTMDESDEVLGMVCENEVTLLLTQRNVIALQINS